jgi:CheY-like chemotaxis protein
MATPAKVKRRVLVVDDEETMRLFLASSLAAHLDVEVQLAGTCEQALRFAEAGPYDAILLDLLMPGIGGLAVLYRVRRSGPNAATPVIVVSAVKDEETIERCMSAGAHAYLTKPVRPTELARTVRKHLGS